MEKSEKQCETISSLETELENSNKALSDRLMQLREAQKLNDQQQVGMENLQEAFKSQEESISSLKNTNQQLQNQCKAVAEEVKIVNSSYEKAKKLYSELQKENGDLSLTVNDQKNDLNQLKINLKTLTDEKETLVQEISDLEESIPNLIEASEIVESLREKVIALEDEVEEKKQQVRHLQLRSTEMKKMLQKEMKAGLEVNDTSSQNSSMHFEPPPSPISYLKPSFSKVDYRKDLTPSPIDLSNGLSEINLKYIRHVIIKFLTSPSVEARQMVRAISTILHFTDEEEKTLEDYLEWKMSWFGMKPRLPSNSS